MAQADHDLPAAVSRPGLRRHIVEAAAVAALAMVLNLAGNGRTGLWDRDEPRYAGCTREMIARGDWVRPTFNAEPRYHKPILIYWLMRLGLAVGGDNPFGARLVSGLAGAATCVVVLRLGRSLVGPRAGLLAALAMATAPLSVAESKMATTDATLALLLAGSMACLWALNARPSRGAAAGFWSLLGLSILTKGPVGPALVAAAGLATWIFGGPTACWRRLRWRWGPALLLAVVAPWFAAIGLATHGEFFRFAVGDQVLRRVTKGVELHGAPPGYYLVAVLAAFQPWAALLPAAFAAAWPRRRAEPPLAFLLGWVVGPWIVLECFATKLIHYYLPALPACAMLAAWVVALAGSDAPGLLTRLRLGRASLGLLTGLGVASAVALLAGVVAFPRPLKGPCLAMAAAIGAGTAAGRRGFRSGRPWPAARSLAASWAAAMWLLGAWFLPAAEPYRLTPKVAARLASLAAERDAPPILFTFQEPSLIYNMGRPAPRMMDRDWLRAALRRTGAASAALIERDVAMLGKVRGISVELLDEVRGFDVNRGQVYGIQMALIRPTDEEAPDEPEPAIGDRPAGTMRRRGAGW